MNATDNNELRFDAIKLIERYNQDFVIVKYKGETEPKKILKDGSEIPVGINVYDSNSENINYIYNGVSFTFNEIKQYFHPKERKDIKAGMIVEILHNKIWVEKTILNPDLEWENLYKLLSKYDKVRVSF
jgi:hypothetical protein